MGELELNNIQNQEKSIEVENKADYYLELIILLLIIAIMLAIMLQFYLNTLIQNISIQ